MPVAVRSWTISVFHVATDDAASGISFEFWLFLFVWHLPFDLPSKDGHASSYSTTGIALRVTGVLKPPHHDKVETPTHSRKNYKNCWDDWHCWRFSSAFRHFVTPFVESFPMSKFSWMMDPIHSREMPSCSAIDLAEIRWPSKMSLLICSIISGVVTVLGRTGRGAS